MPRGSLHPTEQRLVQTLSDQGGGRYGDLDSRGVPGDDRPLRPAAVLLLLERTPGYQVVLTKRTNLVEHHKGEISLAGGMADPGDRDAVHTALREAHEELAIAPNDVTILGQLGELVTVTGFAVRPVVGAIDAGYPMVPQETEVERILRVPLAVLRDPYAWFEDVRLWRGQRHVLRSVRWEGEIIWGATSRILQRFLDVVPAAIL
jgi:8-oxo-dGTP pyrophosphatase MutT (NUDIX family)